MESLQLFLIEYHRWITGLHMFGFTLGFGGALISDTFFLKFLKEFRISEEKLKILKGFSRVVWIGLFIIVISGASLFFSEPERFLASEKFILKMLVVGIIIINGLFLNIIITPRLPSIEFKDLQGKLNKERGIRRLSFALGSVSAASWSSAFVLGVFRSSPTSFEVMFGAYLLVLISAVIGSQILEYLVSQKGFSVPL